MISKELKNIGYNLSEKLVFYGCILTGTVAPTLIMRYGVMGNIMNIENWKQECASWVVSLATNLIHLPTWRYKEPIEEGKAATREMGIEPLIGLSMLSGMHIGGAVSEKMMNRRNRKERLSSII